MLFNEIYTHVYEKNKDIQPLQRTGLQLMTVFNRNKYKDLINNFKSNANTHSTLDDEILIHCGTYPFFSKRSQMVSY